MAFFYDRSDTYERNFKRWYKSHKLEYEAHRYPAFDEPTARAKFDRHFGSKKIKITRVKKYV